MTNNIKNIKYSLSAFKFACQVLFDNLFFETHINKAGLANLNAKDEKYI